MLPYYSAFASETSLAQSKTKSQKRIVTETLQDRLLRSIIPSHFVHFLLRYSTIFLALQIYLRFPPAPYLLKLYYC